MRIAKFIKFREYDGLCGCKNAAAKLEYIDDISLQSNVKISLTRAALLKLSDTEMHTPDAYEASIPDSSNAP